MPTKICVEDCCCASWLAMCCGVKAIVELPLSLAFTISTFFLCCADPDTRCCFYQYQVQNVTELMEAHGNNTYAKPGDGQTFNVLSAHFRDKETGACCFAAPAITAFGLWSLKKILWDKYHLSEPAQGPLLSAPKRTRPGIQ